MNMRRKFLYRVQIISKFQSMPKIKVNAKMSQIKLVILTHQKCTFKVKEFCLFLSICSVHQNLKSNIGLAWILMHDLVEPIEWFSVPLSFNLPYTKSCYCGWYCSYLYFSNYMTLWPFSSNWFPEVFA